MSYNTPIRIHQDGSVQTVNASGSVLIRTGGSIQVESGGAVNVASGAAFNVAGGISVGGTLARWAYGTSALTSGVGTIATGLTRVFSANANPLLGETQGAGSAAFVFVDLSLSGAGSVIYRLGSVGGALWNANGTIAWQCFGT